jgi:hypothetical protein
MTLRHARRSGCSFRRAATLAGVTLVLLSACTSTEPSTPFGTYRLKSCLFIDSIPHPLPCTLETQTPGDSESFTAGSLTLRADSTWENTFQQAFFTNGNWGPTTPSTFGGHFTLVGDQGSYQVFELASFPTPLYIAIRGRELTYGGSWIYTR